MKYYKIINNNQKGPYSLEELIEQQIQRNELVWHRGLEDWVKASNIKELNEYFDELPPPLPEPPPVPKNLPFGSYADTSSNLNLLSVSNRFWGFVIDMVYYIIAFFFLLYYIFEIEITEQWMWDNAFTFFIFIVLIESLFVYSTAKTTSKFLFRSEIVKTDNKKITFLNSFIRSFTKYFFNSIPTALHYIGAGKRFLHDKWSKTAVLKTTKS